MIRLSSIIRTFGAGFLANYREKLLPSHHQALAKVFRAKMLGAIRKEGFAFPAKQPEKWIVNCKSVGSGEKALVYLGRYLYRGVIQEKDIVACEDGKVTFRYPQR